MDHDEDVGDVEGQSVVGWFLIGRVKSGLQNT